MRASKSTSRTICLGAKFSPREALMLREKARRSGCTLSALLHDLSVRGTVHPRPNINPICIEQWRALAPLAANINQLSRAVHQGRTLGQTDVSDGIEKLQSTLKEIRDALVGEERTAA